MLTTDCVGVCSWSLVCSGTRFRVAQKRIPYLEINKILLNLQIKLVKFECKRGSRILLVDIKYPVRDQICDLSVTVTEAAICVK